MQLYDIIIFKGELRKSYHLSWIRNSRNILGFYFFKVVQQLIFGVTGL